MFGWSGRLIAGGLERWWRVSLPAIPWIIWLSDLFPIPAGRDACPTLRKLIATAGESACASARDRKT
jgi:hypothetical protein